MKNSSGFSLIELLVVIAFLAIILVVLVGMIIQIFIQTGISNEAYKAQDDALVSMNYITKELRQAADVIAAQPQSITIREYVSSGDAVPSQVRFYLQGTNLMRGQIPPSGSAPNYTYDSASETFKTLSTRVTNGANTIFTYYDQNNNQLTGTILLASVTLVSTDLSFKQDQRSKDLSVSTKVQLRFRKYNL
ncbi:MAG: hypothetical protein A3F35_02925 [Candidatus Woykebacteria bacterium RIFCSPHIGHO2_12_FULL_45_10]|uniref:Prepilin-type N-terminal cleavage/methylation domain-containing protein n=1 Tax=Candidatus Woykebacteria bacterium RIFCSPHIGHO2_12_FULL_45_10 TaxID=1802603 RepID=A0A1G1WQE6_9BACT|nr:MAG: hypothetical protein A3F35_02925 [Candidatus Woykebacteria bacterium RIFCSPHIGHO2_12_FULL_45_10]